MGTTVKRIGNNIDIVIMLRGDIPSALGSEPKYEIIIKKAYGRSYIVPNEYVEGSVDSGMFSFTWKAKHQKGVGDYTLILRMTNDDDGFTIDQTQAIRLTQHTCQGTDTDDYLSIIFTL